MRIVCGKLKSYLSCYKYALHLLTLFLRLFTTMKKRIIWYIIIFYFWFALFRFWVFDSVGQVFVCAAATRRMRNTHEQALEGPEHMSWPNRFQVLWTVQTHTHTPHTRTHPAQLSIKCRLKHSSSASKLSCATNMHELNVPQRSLSQRFMQQLR